MFILLQVWMLTGDKLETAICIAKSSKLVSRLQDIYVFQNVNDRSEAHLELNSLRRKNEAALIISGDSLQVDYRNILFGKCLLKIPVNLILLFYIL